MLITVFICIPTLASAGAERFVTELAININKENFKPIILITNKLELSSPFYQKLINNRIEVIDVSDKKYITEVKKTVAILKQYNPRIIHSNVGAALHILIPLFLSGIKTKHIFTVHSMGYRIFNGIKKKIIGICFKSKAIIPVAICDKVKQSLIQEYRLKPNEVELVYNGVDTKIFTPEHKENKEITFISVGTLYKIKNHALLIDAFKILHKNNPESKLIIVGDGELREELINRTKEYGLEKSVLFEGNQSNVAKYLHLSDIYCCTSEVEGLPISVLEAMACGLPVITTPAGGVVDIIKDGENGYIINNHPNDIAEKMETLLLNSEIRMRMGEKSRRMAERLDIKKCSEQYEIIYTKYSNQLNGTKGGRGK